MIINVPKKTEQVGEEVWTSPDTDFPCWQVVAEHEYSFDIEIIGADTLY